MGWTLNIPKIIPITMAPQREIKSKAMVIPSPLNSVLRSPQIVVSSTVVELSFSLEIFIKHFWYLPFAFRLAKPLLKHLWWVQGCVKAYCKKQIPTTRGSPQLAFSFSWLMAYLTTGLIVHILAATESQFSDYHIEEPSGKVVDFVAAFALISFSTRKVWECCTALDSPIPFLSSLHRAIVLDLCHRAIELQCSMVQRNKGFFCGPLSAKIIPNHPGSAWPDWTALMAAIKTGRDLCKNLGLRQWLWSSTVLVAVMETKGAKDESS